MMVLLTGSEGRIGKHVAAALQARGHRVRGLDLAPATQGSAADELIVGDFGDRSVLRKALIDVDAVVHLAALMSWHPKDADRMHHVNVTATFALLQAAERAELERFVFASSGEVYPELAPAYQPLDELHPTMPTSVYGLTKLMGEEMVRRYGRNGHAFAIARFSHTQAASELLDPTSFFSGPRFFIKAKIRQLRTLPTSPAVERTIAALEKAADDGNDLYIGRSPEGVPYRMGIGDARDLAEGVAILLDHPGARDETFNIGPRESVSFDELVPAIAAATGLVAAPVNLFTTPYRYDTSIMKAMNDVGYAPRFDAFRMVEEAAGARV